jgi:hypothetical protein
MGNGSGPDNNGNPRGLTHPEMIDHFHLGFSNRTLGYRLPDKNRKSGAEMRGRLQKLGILRRREALTPGPGTARQQ